MNLAESIRSGVTRAYTWFTGAGPQQTQTVSEAAPSVSAFTTERSRPRPATAPRFTESANPRGYLNRLAEQHRDDEIQESLYDPFDTVDMREPFFDDGYQWIMPVVPGAGQQGQPTITWHGFANEQELLMAQTLCRRMLTYSEFVVNGLHNRVNYTVGPGYRFKVVMKDGDDTANADAAKALQDFVDAFLKRNKWLERQRETILRHDRDGECFRRIFRRADGMTDVRFVEPWQVANPGGTNAVASHTMFGIRTVEGDNETPEAYFVRQTPGGQDFEEVEASDIQHLKCRADMNQRRGVPLFWVSRFNVRRAYKTLQNIAAKSEIAAAIPFTRKHVGGTATSASAFASSITSNSYSDPYQNGRTVNQTKYGPATILDHSDRTEYEGTNFAQGMDLMIEGLAQMLRAMAAAGEMPEFMFSVDASNGNFASTLVAEGPVVKSFQALQSKLRDADLWIIDEAVEHAIASGLLPANVLEVCDIQVDLPEIATHDKIAETQADKIRADAGILSPQTWCSKNDLDYTQEIENIEAHKARGFAWPPAAPSPIGGDTTNPPESGEGEPGDKLPDNANKDDGTAELEGLRTPEELFAEIERRYSDFVKQEGKDEGKWVTIDGAHVHIDGDGNIDKGPKAMVGKDTGKTKTVYTGQPKGKKKGDSFSPSERHEFPVNHAVFYTDSKDVASLYSGDSEQEKSGETSYSLGRKGMVYKSSLDVTKFLDGESFDEDKWARSLLDGIVDVDKDGYSSSDIADALGLSPEYDDLERDKQIGWTNKRKSFFLPKSFDTDEAISKMWKDRSGSGDTLEFALNGNPSAQALVMFPVAGKHYISANGHNGIILNDGEHKGTKTYVSFDPKNGTVE